MLLSRKLLTAAAMLELQCGDYSSKCNGLCAHAPKVKPTFQEVQNEPGQIEAPDLASTLAPKSILQKRSKNTLIRSDTTDPIETPLMINRSLPLPRWEVLYYFSVTFLCSTGKAEVQYGELSGTDS